MPPKKQAKLAVKPVAPKTVKGKKSDKRQKSNNSKKNVTSSMETRSKNKAGTSTFQQAAEGAGIFTTPELQEKRRSAVQQAIANDDLVELYASNDQFVSDQEPEAGEQTAQEPDSSDESEGEMAEDEQPGPSQNEPLKRKIPFNRETQVFDRVALSPGSLDQGKDTRDLAKLQELLSANPGAISTLDSMIQMIKGSNQDMTNPPAEVPPAQAQAQTVSHQPPRMLPPPPPLETPARPGTLPRLNNVSETTIYTKAVPVESPTQHLPAQDNVVVHGPVNVADVAVMNDFWQMSVTDPEPVGDPSALVTESQPSEDPRVVQQREERAASKRRTDERILEAERQRITMAKPTAGNPTFVDTVPEPISLDDEQRESLLNKPGSSDLSCDDQLYQLTAHLDRALIEKIKNGEYMDFSKLVPRDSVIPDNEKKKFQIVDDEGKPAFAPYEEKDAGGISSYKKWELAFDIYAGIFTKFHPARAAELLEYRHIIRRGAEMFQWANVYNYDKIFRQHVERNPGRTWAKKHQDTWSNHVRDQKTSSSPPGTEFKKKKPPCKFFNRPGGCKRGRNCDHDHKCSYCFKFGHGRHECFKAKKATPTATPSSSASSQSSAAASGSSTQQ